MPGWLLKIPEWILHTKLDISYHLHSILHMMYTFHVKHHICMHASCQISHIHMSNITYTYMHTQDYAHIHLVSYHDMTHIHTCIHNFTHIYIYSQITHTYIYSQITHIYIYSSHFAHVEQDGVTNCYASPPPHPPPPWHTHTPVPFFQCWGKWRQGLYASPPTNRSQRASILWKEARLWPRLQSGRWQSPIRTTCSLSAHRFRV